MSPFKFPELFYFNSLIINYYLERFTSHFHFPQKTTWLAFYLFQIKKKFGTSAIFGK